MTTDQLAELITAARTAEPKRQVKVVEHLLSRLGGGSDTAAVESASTIEQMLFDLVVTTATAVRLETAEKLARMDKPPRDLILRLARDEITVAEPLLRLCRALLEDDLVGIVHDATEAHRVVIADRPDIGERVTSALAVRREIDVLRTMIANTSAKLSTTALEACIETARQDVALHAPLAARRDMPMSFVKLLYTIVDISLRAELARNHPQVIHMLSEQQASRPDRGFSLSRELAKGQSLSADYLVRTLNANRLDLFFAALAHKADVEIDAAEAAIKTHGVLGCALLCKAAGLTEFMHLRARRALIETGALGQATSQEHLDKADGLFQRITITDARSKLID